MKLLKTNIIMEKTSREYAEKLAKKTALEFTKWKDENYNYIGDNTYVLTELTFQELSQSEYESNFKTSEQLFNEWNNLKT